MRRVITLLIAACLLVLTASNLANSQDELKIWKEFVTAWMNDEITSERIRPFASTPKETVMGWLNSIKEKASLKELEAEPEYFRVDDKVHFIIQMTYGARKVDYCFTFLTEGDKWYFHLLEAIFIRLDKTPAPPTSEFPDIEEDKKAWDREEWRVSKQVRLFNFLSEEKGKDFAFDWLCDGRGYFVASKARVPFVTPKKAFILYLCWEQANLRGNNVTLEKLNDDEAFVRMELIYFALYKMASHLKEQISYEDYRRIFETIWQDRAEKAGWKLEITYEEESYRGEKCLLHFTK
jgi:hypothetical protein